jgi:hypothetical protein
VSYAVLAAHSMLITKHSRWWCQANHGCTCLLQGLFIHVSPAAPSTTCDSCPEKPWWKDRSYRVRDLTTSWSTHTAVLHCSHQVPAYSDRHPEDALLDTLLWIGYASQEWQTVLLLVMALHHPVHT